MFAGLTKRERAQEYKIRIKRGEIIINITQVQRIKEIAMKNYMLTNWTT